MCKLQSPYMNQPRFLLVDRNDYLPRHVSLVFCVSLCVLIDLVRVLKEATVASKWSDDIVKTTESGWKPCAIKQESHNKG